MRAFRSRNIARGFSGGGPGLEEIAPKICTHAVEIYVFKVESVDMAWEVAVLFSGVSQSTVFNGLEEARGIFTRDR